MGQSPKTVPLWFPLSVPTLVGRTGSQGVEGPSQPSSQLLGNEAGVPTLQSGRGPREPPPHLCLTTHDSVGGEGPGTPCQALREEAQEEAHQGPSWDCLREAGGAVPSSEPRRGARGMLPRTEGGARLPSAGTRWAGHPWQPPHVAHRAQCLQHSTAPCQAQTQQTPRPCRPAQPEVGSSPQASWSAWPHAIGTAFTASALPPHPGCLDHWGRAGPAGALNWELWGREPLECKAEQGGSISRWGARPPERCLCPL